jgi:hypothetical protein
VLVAAAGSVCWLVYAKPTAPVRISRSFPAPGVRKVILRAWAGKSTQVVVEPAAATVEVSGFAAGGAEGYHSPNPFWRETPAAQWGLDFVSARHGKVLVISTKNEIEYIHHHYVLESVTLRVPAGIEVVCERRDLTGDGAPDLEALAP